MAENTNLIDYALGMRYSADDVEIYQEIAQAYIDEADTKLGKLQAFYNEKDWKNYSIIAHSIKSTSLTIGAEGLSALAKEHEFAGKEDRGDDIIASYEKFVELYKAVLAELKEHLQQL